MYGDQFYVEEGVAAAKSAAVVIPWLQERHPFGSAIDIGGGTGEWAAAAGAATVVDFDVPSELRVTGPEHLDADLVNGWPCAGYELAICLEVAEHLPPTSAEALVEGLAQANMVLFSAATPGQVGVGHINCRPHDYWHDLFARHGKTPTYIGGEFSDPVADFYRRNLFLYS